ncbi:hypothetical protein BX600DRAFT_437539 [Xylariales sp. PMI_506]|nr:hypothetical protein BX600DRAFT_437539 [Xylariales sp. PMI_506]
MDPPYIGGGSVRRARERAEAGLQASGGWTPPSSIPRLPIRNPNNGPARLQAPPGLQTRDGNIGVAISRPTPVPQWPLAGSITSTSSEAAEAYVPPSGASPPRRPPRPSRVPSMLDASRVQDHTPVFQYTPQNPRISELSVPETPATSSSRPLTDSSMGSIPDFPVPAAIPPGPPRRSANLGPPPSSRRGNSSYYSTASFVSPIPEESPRTRSHASFASSAAIPESFGGTISPSLSQDDNYYYDDTIAEESVYSDDTDMRGLVRSASIGRKGKPALVTTRRSSDRGEMVPIVLPIQPPNDTAQPTTFNNDTSYIESSSSSEALNSGNGSKVGAAVTTDNNMLGAPEAASAAELRKMSTSPRPFRLSAIRRPPRLNIDAVREAEARGSLTSLPDLIKRATRLAAMMDKGRRPASRFDEMDFTEEMFARDPEKRFSVQHDYEKHQSGLSDMLAAFPPPAQANIRRSMRESVATAWPLPFRKAPPDGPNGPGGNGDMDLSQSDAYPEKQRRRCCGLPLWGFLLLMFILVCIIAAAVIVPVEFLVIQKQGQASSTSQASTSLTACKAELTCANGGTNVITDGVCSCICSNGYTGTNCTISSTQGCTTTTVTSDNSTLTNVTIGEAIPRLVEVAQTNFSIPLSTTTILSKFNSANLSCVTENALVTFNGEYTTESDDVSEAALLKAESAASITISISPSETLTIVDPSVTGSVTVIVSTLTEPLTSTDSSFSAISTITLTQKSKTTGSSTATATSTAAASTSTFALSDQVTDFARIAVLYVLQEETLSEATTAQSTLQSFFNDVDSSTGVSISQASNVTIGGGNTIDFIKFTINLG